MFFVLSALTTPHVPQIKECGQALRFLCNSIGTTVFLIGHVTKSGEVAGPKLLEHIVDTVLFLEGDQAQGSRCDARPAGHARPAGTAGRGASPAGKGHWGEIFYLIVGYPCLCNCWSHIDVGIPSRMNGQQAG